MALTMANVPFGASLLIVVSGAHYLAKRASTTALHEEGSVHLAESSSRGVYMNIGKPGAEDPERRPRHSGKRPPQTWRREARSQSLNINPRHHE